MFKRLRSAAVALLIICSCVLAAGCNNDIRADINISKGPSVKFSDAEIDSAIDCAIESFSEEFKGNSLTDIWYDEQRSDTWIRSYFSGDNKNAIALLSNIKTGGSDVCGGFEPNDTYTDWCWILVRESENDEWTVKTSGY